MLGSNGAIARAGGRKRRAPTVAHLRALDEKTRAAVLAVVRPLRLARHHPILRGGRVLRVGVERVVQVQVARAAGRRARVPRSGIAPRPARGCRPTRFYGATGDSEE